MKGRIKNTELRLYLQDVTLLRTLVLLAIVPLTMWGWQAGMLLAVAAAVVGVTYTDYTPDEEDVFEYQQQ